MPILVSDLEQLGRTALEEYGREVARRKSAPGPEAELQAQRLEAKLESLYVVAVKMAQRTEALDEVAAIWSRMVAICDSMARALSDSQGKLKHSESYDRILDIRNECEENRALHA